MDDRRSYEYEIERKSKGKSSVNKSQGKTDGYDLRREIVMRKPEGGFDDFEKKWTKHRTREGAHPHEIFAEDKEYKSKIDPKYLTYVGHSSIGEAEDPSERMLWGLTLNNVVNSAIRMLKEYPSIDTINFYACWTAVPNHMEKNSTLNERLQEKKAGSQLSFCEHFTVELAKRAALGDIDKTRVENLTIVGCMGKVSYNPSGRASANKDVKPSGSDSYVSASNDGTFASINSGKFIQEYNKYRSDILDTKPATEENKSEDKKHKSNKEHEENKSDEESKSHDSSSESEENEKTVATFNPFNALKIS